MRIHNVIQKVITPIKGNAEYDLFTIYVTFFAELEIIFSFFSFFSFYHFKHIVFYLFL